MAPRTKYQITWCTDDDVDSLSALENLCFPPDQRFPSEVIANQVRHKKDLSAYCLHNKKMVGYCLALRERRTLHLLSVGVHPEHRLKGMGVALIQWIVNHSKVFLERIECIVYERSLDAQRFLKGSGFLCTRVLRNHFNDGKDDGFVFERSLIDEDN
jgi:ribosomal protein S18 acetylase RimI-like enzyme